MTEKNGKIYSSVKQAGAYLRRTGREISDKSFYRHIKQGWIQPKPWSLDDLDSYADKFLRSNEKPADATKGKVSSSRELRETQIEKAKVGVEYMRLRADILKEKYIERSVCTQLLAQRAMIYKDILKNYSFEIAQLIQHRLNEDQKFFWDLQIEIEKDLNRHFAKISDMPFIDFDGHRVGKK